MIPRGLAKRYALAIFSSALKKSIADELQEDMKSFCELQSSNPVLKNFLLSPQVLTDEKKKLVKKILRERVSSTFVNFLMLLIDKKRFELVEEIAEAYNVLYERYLGIVEVKVTTATLLDHELEKKLIGKLERETRKKIRLKKRVDRKILGGMILIMENKIIDGSLRFHLETLRRNLKAVKVY